MQISRMAMDWTSQRVEWQRQPRAQTVAHELVTKFCANSAAARQFAQRMLRETGTRFIDWVDFVAPPREALDRGALVEAGFTLNDADGTSVAEHPGGMFPTIRLDEPRVWTLGLKVESVAHFLNINAIADSAVEGAPYAALRMARIALESDAELWIVERHGQLGFEHALQLINAGVADLGHSRACDLFFGAERTYWEGRNRAGRLQKARQDRLGLGWGNHDHHTYRSSREHFADLIGMFGAAGLLCREQFYAGIEAGWGAQILEHQECRIVVFADVDLSPEEVSGDFAHSGLPPQNSRGTIGLWCQLHGEALLQAGMHHLEAQFDFEAARAQLRHQGVMTMEPFTEFPHLRQVFTQGEIW